MKKLETLRGRRWEGGAHVDELEERLMREYAKQGLVVLRRGRALLLAAALLAPRLVPRRWAARGDGGAALLHATAAAVPAGAALAVALAASPPLAPYY